MFGVGLVADQIGPAKTILMLAVLSLTVIPMYRSLLKQAV